MPSLLSWFLGSYIFKNAHASHRLHRHWDVYCWSAFSGASAWKEWEDEPRTSAPPEASVKTTAHFRLGQKVRRGKILWWTKKGGYSLLFCELLRAQMKVLLAQSVYVLLWGRIKAHSQLPSSRTGQSSCLAGTHWRASGDTLQKLICRFPTSLFSAFPCSILRRMGVIIST